MNKSVIFFWLLFLISCIQDKKEYYKNGSLMSSERIVNGKRNGEVVYYDSLGNIELQLNFKNGLEDGAYRKYKNGKLFVKGNYQMGKAEGDWYDYYQNGNIEQYSVYRENELLNTKLYDTLGVIKGEFNEKNGKTNGPYKIYKNGKLWLSGTYTDGKVTGSVTQYDENGKIVKVVPAK